MADDNVANGQCSRCEVIVYTGGNRAPSNVVMQNHKIGDGSPHIVIGRALAIPGVELRRTVNIVSTQRRPIPL